MYSYLIKASSVPSNYSWFTYRGEKPANVDYRGCPVQIKSGMRFGVCLSAKGNYMRLVLAEDPSKIMTVNEVTAELIADGVGRD